ncbi:hypothetical protein BD779DRAFT_1787255 [Infundibulicybe gibba]|nr:hypothetical protein BD779DRAFT_1787255 [Infundibulicybe gibba]
MVLTKRLKRGRGSSSVAVLFSGHKYQAHAGRLAITALQYKVTKVAALEGGVLASGMVGPASRMSNALDNWRVGAKLCERLTSKDLNVSGIALAGGALLNFEGAGDVGDELEGGRQERGGEGLIHGKREAFCLSGTNDEGVVLRRKGVIGEEYIPLILTEPSRGRYRTTLVMRVELAWDWLRWLRSALVNIESKYLLLVIQTPNRFTFISFCIGPRHTSDSSGSFIGG